MRIDEEFKALISALQPREYEELERSIIEEGCRDSLVTWNGTIVDGHNRYEICNKHGVEYRTIEKEFESRDDVKIWMITNQFARRNITAYQRSLLALTLEPLISAKAKEKEHERKTTFQKSEKSNLPTFNNTKEIAKKAGVSHDTIAKVKKIKEKATAQVKDKLSNGEISINQAYTEIKKQERKAVIDETRKNIESGAYENPVGEYDVIVIDPPWNYGREYDPEGSRVANPYPEMTQAQLLEYDLHAKPDAVLYLWTTHAFLWDAKELLDHWGFAHKALLVWDKQKMGIGAWLRMQCEFCIVGIKGKPFYNNTTWRDIISEPRREHSRKPEVFYQMVQECTAGARIEHFSQTNREGFMASGAQAGLYVER